MGVKIYYIVEVVIFSFLAYCGFFKPEIFSNFIRNKGVIRLLGFIAILAAIANLIKFLRI